MAADGSFQRQTRRTKPYGYSILNLDSLATICQLLTDKNENLWFVSDNGRKIIEKGIEFLYPFITDKSKWSFQKDVMYWDGWPVAQPFLIFGSVAFKEKNWFDTWKRLSHSPEEEEVIRNLPERNPLIWF